MYNKKEDECVYTNLFLILILDHVSCLGGGFKWITFKCTACAFQNLITYPFTKKIINSKNEKANARVLYIFNLMIKREKKNRSPTSEITGFYKIKKSYYFIVSL